MCKIRSKNRHFIHFQYALSITANLIKSYDLMYFLKKYCYDILLGIAEISLVFYSRYLILSVSFFTGSEEFEIIKNEKK